MFLSGVITSKRWLDSVIFGKKIAVAPPVEPPIVVPQGTSAGVIPASVTYWPGRTDVYARIRNPVSGYYWRFAIPDYPGAWQATGGTTATIRTLTEHVDNDPYESRYSGTIPVPPGGPWILEYFAGNDRLGDELTPPDYSTLDAPATGVIAFGGSGQTVSGYVAITIGSISFIVDWIYGQDVAAFIDGAVLRVQTMIAGSGVAATKQGMSEILLTAAEPGTTGNLIALSAVSHGAGDVTTSGPYLTGGTDNILGPAINSALSSSHGTGSWVVPDGFAAALTSIKARTDQMTFANGGIVSSFDAAYLLAELLREIPAAILDATEHGLTIRALIGRLSAIGSNIDAVALIPVPSQPGYCALVADLLSFGLTPRIGVKLTAVVKYPPATIAGRIVDGSVTWSAETDATGRATLILPQGVVWKVTFAPLRMPVDVDTTDQVGISLASLIR